MTKTLTEQWREGTLKEGFYYILFASRFGKDYIAIDMFIPDEKDFMYSSCEDVKEVLAPVPSYDEIKRLQEQLNEANEVIKLYYKPIVVTRQITDDYVVTEEIPTDSSVAFNYLKKWDVK